MEILLIQQEILKISDIINNISIFLNSFLSQFFLYFINIILFLNSFFMNIFETVIGFQYPNSQPCWAKPNTLVELFKNPKMLIFTNNINILNFNFDIYTPKPLWESISIPENSIFAEPKIKTTIYLSEIKTFELSDEEIDKLTNAIKFIEIQINIEEFNLNFATDNINNKPPFSEFILSVFNIFSNNYNNNYNFFEINSKFLNIKINALFQHEIILIDFLKNFLLNWFQNIEIIFLLFLFKNEFFIPKILFINNLQQKKFNLHLNIIIFNNKFLFFINTQNKYLKFFKKEFLLNFKKLKFDIIIFNIFYLNYKILKYKYLKLSNFNFKISSQIIQNNLFKINTKYLIKFLKYKKISIFFFKFKDNSIFFFNKKLFKKNVKKIDKLIVLYLKVLNNYKKLYLKIKYFKKSEFLFLDLLYKKYWIKIIKKYINLPKQYLYLFKKSAFAFFYYPLVKKQLYINYEKICIIFNIKTINKNNKISIIIKSLQLYKNIIFFNNYKINYFFNSLKKIKINFLKKIILFISFFTVITVSLLLNIGIFLYIWFNKLISKKLKKKLKKKYYHKYFYHYWYIKTRSYKIKLFFILLKKKIVLFFYNIWNCIINYFKNKIKLFFFKRIIISIILKKIIKLFFFKIILILCFYKFLFLLYYNYFKTINFNFKITLNTNNYYIIIFFNNIFKKFINFNYFLNYINYIAKININLIIFLKKEKNFINYFYKNINFKNFLNKYWNLYLILCFFHLLKNNNIYFDYYFLKNNDFFELIFLNFYISLIFNSNIRIFFIRIFFKSIINNKIFLKKFFFKLKNIKILNLLKKNKFFINKLLFLIYFLKIYLLYLYLIMKKKIKYILKKKMLKIWIKVVF